MNASVFTDMDDIKERGVYMCSPEDFDRSVLGYLASVGIKLMTPPCIERGSNIDISLASVMRVRKKNH